MFRYRACETCTEAEIREAIATTPGAKITGEGLELDVVRYQKPEQAGEEAIRTGVFFMPEAKSPYQRHYTTGKIGYGGRMRTQGRTTYRNPIIVRASSGGRGPKVAFDTILQRRNAYEDMRTEVLNGIGIYTFRGPPTEAAVAELLLKWGGETNLAGSIIAYSKEGNTLPYAIQEHIVAAVVRKAGHDAVIAYYRLGGRWHLSEVFDVRARYYPDTERWERHYEDWRAA